MKRPALGKELRNTGLTNLVNSCRKRGRIFKSLCVTKRKLKEQVAKE
jgi:hypothetical protein